MNRPLVRATGAVLLSTLPSLTACYTYVPIESGAAQPGLGVRARVSASAASRIAPLLGTSDARQLSGTLIDDGRDTIIVEVPTIARLESGSFVQTLHQRVAIARGDLQDLELRKLDRVRTATLVGGAGLILGAVLFKNLQSERGKENLPTGPGTDALLIPLFRFRP
jgi:hypothetical protein